VLLLLLLLQGNHLTLPRASMLCSLCVQAHGLCI
jgi:hypothetical protein